LQDFLPPPSLSAAPPRLSPTRQLPPLCRMGGGRPASAGGVSLAPVWPGYGPLVPGRDAKQGLVELAEHIPQGLYRAWPTAGSPAPAGFLGSQCRWSSTPRAHSWRPPVHGGPGGGAAARAETRPPLVWPALWRSRRPLATPLHPALGARRAVSHETHKEADAPAAPPARQNLALPADVGRDRH